MKRTLGTQLRHLLELADGAVERSYTNVGMAYRPRYTPIMRCLITREPMTVGDIAQTAGMSQPAATQTVSLMIEKGLIETVRSEDGRQKLLKLSATGRGLVPQLQQSWEATAKAALSLDNELPVSLSSTLAAAIEALERKSFDERIREAAAPNFRNEDTK